VEGEPAAPRRERAATEIKRHRAQAVAPRARAAKAAARRSRREIRAREEPRRGGQPRQVGISRNISHELRTPLNAVIGFSEVMQQSLFGPLGHAKYQEYARDIHESGAYLLEVINDILDMSKIEAGRMSLDVETVDVADIVEDSMKVVGQAADER